MNETMKNMFDLTGKVAAVTGSSRGMGKSMAIALAEAGADVILIQRDITNIGTKQMIEKIGRRVGMVECNMTDISRVKEVIDEAVQIFGRLDILVNNAGIQRGHASVDFPESDWDEVYLVNLKSVFILCQRAGKYMIKHGGGKIINIASLMSFMACGLIPAYAAAKGGIVQMTKSLSSEWSKEKVNVNAIAPGFIATDMTPGMENNTSLINQIPANRIGQPDDMKGAVVFLASAASDYICGATILVDGGILNV